MVLAWRPKTAGMGEFTVDGVLFAQACGTRRQPTPGDDRQAQEESGPASQGREEHYAVPMVLTADAKRLYKQMNLPYDAEPRAID